MKKHSQYYYLIGMAMAIAIFACNMPNIATVPQDAPDTSGTSVAQTVEAELARAKPPDTAVTPVVVNEPVSSGPSATNPPPTQTQIFTASPTYTHTPTFTPTYTPTITETFSPTPLPCNRASYIADVNVPDGTVFETGKSFTKTWRLKNTGSCTWTSGYKLVFVNGDQMSGPGSQMLTGGTVPPNGTIDISVNLVAPSEEGTYKGYWKIREPGGATFGVSTGAFWVEIKTKKPDIVLPPPVVGVPDLVANGMQFTPTPGKKDQHGHIQVSVKNFGNAPAGQFTVVWLSNQDKPGCSWTVSGLGVGATKNLSCTFTYTSAEYPAATSSFTVTLQVDPGNQVAESNESNNSISAKWVVVR